MYMFIVYMFSSGFGRKNIYTYTVLGIFGQTGNAIVQDAGFSFSQCQTVPNQSPYDYTLLAVLFVIPIRVGFPFTWSPRLLAPAYVLGSLPLEALALRPIRVGLPPSCDPHAIFQLVFARLSS